jgi:hypothetical protein
MVARMLLIGLWGCAGGGAGGQPPVSDAPVTTPEGAVAVADVVGVRATGSAGAYTLYVTVRSDETGCDQYADWWEVVTPEGELVYRRILTHSHPDDQPFERSGGPVDVQGDDELVVRAHMAPGGFIGEALGGSIDGGFAPASLAEGFAAELESVAPQPESCLF